MDKPAPLAGRLLADRPDARAAERFTDLVSGGGVRIERIVSHGQASPPDFWYCQDEDEFVLVVCGAARLEIEGRPEIALGPGDWLDLPRGVRHRVTYTAPDEDTVWLAVFRSG